MDKIFNIFRSTDKSARRSAEERLSPDSFPNNEEMATAQAGKKPEKSRLNLVDNNGSFSEAGPSEDKH